LIATSRLGSQSQMPSDRMFPEPLEGIPKSGRAWFI
jgi:hypothetical protein